MPFEKVERYGDLCRYPVYNSSPIGGSLEIISVAVEKHVHLLKLVLKWLFF